MAQFVREYLHRDDPFEARRRTADLPAAGRGRRRRGEGLHHRNRSERLSGHVFVERRRRAAPHGTFRALSQTHGTRRIQQSANGGQRARGVHRQGRGSAHVSVARGHRRHGHGPCRQRPELPAGRTFENRRHVVDQARQGGLGLVERLEHLGRGLPGGNQHRDL